MDSINPLVDRLARTQGGILIRSSSLPSVSTAAANTLEKSTLAWPQHPLGFFLDVFQNCTRETSTRTFDVRGQDLNRPAPDDEEAEITPCARPLSGVAMILVNIRS